MGCQVYPSRKFSLLHCKDLSVVGEQLWKRNETLQISMGAHKSMGMLKLTWLFQLVTAYSAPYFAPEIRYLYDQKLPEIDRHLNQGEAEKQLHRKKNIPRWTHENMELLTLDRKHLERCRFTACPVFKVQRDFENWRGVRSLLCVFWKWSQRTRNIAWLTKTALSSYSQKGERFAYELLYTEAIFLNKVLSKSKLPRCWLAEKNFTDPQKFLYDGDNQKMILCIDYLLLFLPTWILAWAIHIPPSRSICAARPHKTLQWVLEFMNFSQEWWTEQGSRYNYWTAMRC